MKVVAVCALILLTTSICGKEDVKDEDELMTVVMVFRHGDRAPERSFPSDRYFNKTYWPMGFGQLTKFGIKRQYELGKWLRNRYSTFLSLTYSPDEIYIRSTDKDRTLMSAYANLAGLYPPKGDQKWSDHIPWQPIPVHTIPRNIDNVIVEKRECPKYNSLLQDAKESDYFLNVNDKYMAFYEQLSRVTGMKVEDVGSVKMIRSTLNSMKHYNTSYLPYWAKDIDWKVMNYLAGEGYRRYTSTPTMKRLRAGPFFHYLLAHFDNTIFTDRSASKAPKMLMISGHDTSLSSILNSMGVFDGHPPDFAATALWELKRRHGSRNNDDSGYYLNFFYKTESGLKKLRMRDCDIDCNLEDFKSILRNIVISIKDWEGECNGVFDQLVKRAWTFQDEDNGDGRIA